MQTAEANAQFISVQIDMSGSTNAKARIREATKENLARRHDLYKKLYLELVKAEVRFYRRLQSDDGGRDSGIPIESCFGVKGIGDEQWLIVLPGTNGVDLASVAVKSIWAALDVVGECGWIDLQSDSDESNPDNDDGQVGLPFKVFIDVVGGDALDISDIRAQAYREAFNAGEVFPRTNLSIHEAIDRVSNFSITTEATTVGLNLRPDFIGWEIDRLFRAARFSRPGFVTVGDDLLKILDVRRQKQNHSRIDEIDCIGLRNPRFSDIDLLLSIVRPINAEDLRGIGRPYVVHRIFQQRRLQALLDKMLITRRQDQEPTPRRDGMEYAQLVLEAISNPKVELSND